MSKSFVAPAPEMSAYSPVSVPTRGRQASAFVDPMRALGSSTPSGSYMPSGPATPTSPRLMRTSTPRRTTQSPAAGAGSPRMPRFVSLAEQSLSGSASFRLPSSPTVASSQNFSTASGFSYGSSNVTSSRYGTPGRVGTPTRHAMPQNTPPTVRLHHGSRPSTPTGPARARSPVMTMGSPMTPRGGSASNQYVGLASSGGHVTTRQLLRELAASWRNRGSENQQAFGEGGYMTVSPGDVVNSRYELIVKLGWGEFSTVWLAFDRKANNLHRTFVAVKIAKCRADVTRGTKYECYLLAFIRKRVSRDAPVAGLLDCFEARGRYGDHLCMTMPLMGSNMLCVIEQFKARGRRRRTEREQQMVKEITVAILQSLAHLEKANVLHTDLKPENVLVSAPDIKVARQVGNFCRSRGILADNDQLRQIEEGDTRAPIATLADFGLSLLLEPRETQDTAAHQVVSRKELNVPRAGHLRNERGMLIQTREYRAPEVLFGTDFNCRTDMWSVGCMAYEMLTGDFLMDPKRKTRVEREMDVEHVAMMMQILGPVPNRIATGNGKHIRRYFDANGRFNHADKYAAYPRRSIATELETFLEPAEAERAAQFIMSCFTYDPAERCHANDLIRHSWLRGAAISAAAAADL